MFYHLCKLLFVETDIWKIKLSRLVIVNVATDTQNINSLSDVSLPIEYWVASLSMAVHIHIVTFFSDGCLVTSNSHNLLSRCTYSEWLNTFLKQFSYSNAAWNKYKVSIRYIFSCCNELNLQMYYTGLIYKSFTNLLMTK